MNRKKILMLSYRRGSFIEEISWANGKHILENPLGYITGDILSLNVAPDIIGKDTSSCTYKLEENEEFERINEEYNHLVFPHMTLNLFSEFVKYKILNIEDIGIIKNISDFLNMCQQHEEFMNFDSYRLFLGFKQLTIPSHTFVTYPERLIRGNELFRHPFGMTINELFAQEKYGKPPYVICDHYECNTMGEFILASIYHTLEMGFVIKKCENCDKFFVPENRSDTKFCERNSPQNSNKTCKEYGKYANYLSKTQNDEATKLYKQIYNSKANKVKRCQNASFKEQLESFIGQSAQWKSDVKSGEKIEHEFIEWLKSIKEKKV